MQYDLFGTFLDTMNTLGKSKTRSKLEEAIFKQKNEAAWETEQKRKQEQLERERRDLNLVSSIDSLASTFVSEILNAIEKGKTSCSFQISDDIWNATVIYTSGQHQFCPQLMISNDYLYGDSELFYQVASLANSGVSYYLTKSNHPMDYGPDMVLRSLTLHW